MILDMLGQKLEVEDIIAWPHAGLIRIGRVKSIGDKTLKVMVNGGECFITKISKTMVLCNTDTENFIIRHLHV